MKEEEAIRSYFGQPGFERFMKLLGQQYMASKEGVRGYVTLTDISDLERRVLDAFYETYSPPDQGETRRYSLKKFERLLKKSRFELTVSELLALLNGEPVLTRLEQIQRMNEKWEGIIHSAIEESCVTDTSHYGVMSWAQGLIEESSLGSRNLRILFAKSPEEARRCLKHCLAALNRMVAESNKKPIRLPVLAAEITGDAHALDWKSPLGRLFWWGLTSIQERPIAVFSEESQLDQNESPFAHTSQAILIREGYRRGGIADDDLSSQVMLYAPELFGVREERILTIRQVEQLSSERLGLMRYERIYMVENPSIFAELIDADAQKHEGTGVAGLPVFICGNGQPTTAVIKLLDALLSTREGIVLYYAGDLDPVGLSIAQSLQLRYSKAFRAWGMEKELYLRYADRGIPLTEIERSRLQECRYDWDVTLAGVMNDKGVKLHQELWVAELLQDLERS